MSKDDGIIDLAVKRMNECSGFAEEFYDTDLYSNIYIGRQSCIDWCSKQTYGDDVGRAVSDREPSSVHRGWCCGGH